MNHDIITIGSAVRDVFLVSDEFQLIKDDRFATGTGECVSLGSKIEIDEIHYSSGGGATNAAVTFARLGNKTATVCKIGDDETGEEVLADLERENVRTSLIRPAKGKRTGYSTLLTDKKTGERSVLVYRGIAKKLAPADLPFTKMKPEWFYLTSLGGNMALAGKIVRHAAKVGANIAWNPGGTELKKGFKAFKPLLSKVTVFNINREEAELLSGTRDVKKASEKLAANGNTVVITDGPDGTYAYRDGELVHAGTTDAPVVSRTGAGDAFGSGFVASLRRGDDLGTALAIGTLNAEGVIGSYGAKSGILKTWPGKAKIKKIAVKKM